MDKKVVLITGAAKGIGKAIALRYAQAGYSVALHYRGSEQQALDTKAEIEALHTTAKTYQCDIANFDAVEVMIQAIIKDFGKIDVLVNNAGITEDALVLRMQEAQFDAVIDTNLKGTFNVSKFVAKEMFRKKSGKIVNVSSVIGIGGNIGQVNYAASKAGIIGLTKAMAKEFASRNILVNAIAPGFIETQMTASLSDKVQESIKTQIPLKRYGSASDVANLAYFLGSEENTYINAETIRVDGGMMI
ncbi:MAG: 3-oxoacyl-[acyl-carrier-protein] reductase [Erysipelotrichaceae bacterium]